MSYHPPSRSNVVLTVETEYSPPSRSNIVLIVEAPGMLAVRDTIKGVDRGAFKEIGLRPRDEVRVYDYKGFVVSPVDVVKPIEMFGKSITWNFVETIITRDYKGFVLDLRDHLVDEGYMSKGFVFNFREWWITVKDYGPFKEIGKIFCDVVRAYDFKGFVIQPREQVGSADWLLKLVSKEFLEPVKGIDWTSKSLLSHIADAWRVEERIERFYRGTLEISDTASSVDFFSKGVSLVLKDAVKGYDYKGFVPTLVDVVKAFEPKFIASKGLVLKLVDRFVDEGYVAKLPARAVKDMIKPSDFLLKVAFTLFGEAARRVYFHKVHGDIILPEDHNVRNLAAQALVEAVKRLKDKLDQM